ncbi:unnamed protein product [Laminaria digitata]
MMPLLHWDDWTSDRLHWTYPAVVRAFPRCLFDNTDTLLGPDGGGEPQPRERNGRRRRRERGEERGGTRSSREATEAAGAAAAVEAQEEEDQAGEGVAAAAPPLPTAVEEEKAWKAVGSSPPAHLPSPFEPYSLGEVFVRTAAGSDLSPAGVGAGPWRRRWLVLRQTYVFELLRPPPPPLGTLSPTRLLSSPATATARTADSGNGSGGGGDASGGAGGGWGESGGGGGGRGGRGGGGDGGGS